ncbi:uncharacterized protein LOC119291285 [Triticum dicoccoides]|uniref:uncharacterized protein LOC119291285 n=1 Tax=Triticum dicoccoides TaxID=85692 RepID=UPI0018906852|nr:uncharacterized protein LOC119291285 [Triticum dicoccoides]
MATSFDRWEKDPFFLAAEEVQESADRMESVYKIWVQERSGGGSALGGEVGAAELRRELHTALGTAKWQLDELERAIRSNDEVVSAGKDTRALHSNFVAAIGYRILEVENNLNASNVAEGRGTLSWIHLDESERDDLAAFLSASPPQHQDKVVTIPSAGDIQVGSNPTRVRKNISADSSNDSSGSADLSSARAKEDAHRGHRRSVSASADIGSSPMSFPNEREGAAEQSSLGPHRAPLLNIVKACGLPSALKPKPAVKYKKGAVRWAHADKQDLEAAIPLTNPQLGQGLDGYSERSMSYLNTCDGVTYNKKLYGCLGALRKKLQRSQYQIRYGRPAQLIVFALAILIIFVFVFKTIW